MPKTDDYNLGLFFELSADLFCIAGYDGFFKKVNPAFKKLLGYTDEELKSKPINEFVFPEDSEITHKKRKSIINGNPLYNFENRYVSKSGEIFWLSWTSMPVIEDKLVYALAKNVTHKVKLEEDRNELISRLMDVNRALKQLNYTTSHDLRAPVNSLLSVFSLLDVSKIQDEETLEIIDILKLATEGLKQTLNNYVDALGQKDVLNVPIEELDLYKSLQKVMGSIKSLIETSKAEINIDFSEVPTIKFNRAYLESVFLNLLTNSIKYAKPDSVPEITIHSQMENNIVQLIFTDKGQGFDMEKVKNKIFGFQQKFHENSESKGIGLYLIYNHITSLGGSVALESKINEGAKFTISFKPDVFDQRKMQGLPE